MGGVRVILKVGEYDLAFIDEPPFSPGSPDDAHLLFRENRRYPHSWDNDR